MHSLEKTGIKDNSIMYLEKIITKLKLITLSISSNCFTPKFTSKLANIYLDNSERGIFIKNLLISNCKIGDKGAIQLLNSILKSSACVLEHLDLSRNGLHLKTSKFIQSYLDSGIFPRSILEINLEYNNISNRVLADLEEIIYNNARGGISEGEVPSEQIPKNTQTNNLSVKAEKMNIPDKPTSGLAEFLSKVQNKQSQNIPLLSNRLIQKKTKTKTLNKSAIISQGEEGRGMTVDQALKKATNVHTSFTHHAPTKSANWRVCGKSRQPVDHDSYLEAPSLNNSLPNKEKEETIAWEVPEIKSKGNEDLKNKDIGIKETQNIIKHKDLQGPSMHRRLSPYKGFEAVHSMDTGNLMGTDSHPFYNSVNPCYRHLVGLEEDKGQANQARLRQIDQFLKDSKGFLGDLGKPRFISPEDSSNISPSTVNHKDGNILPINYGDSESESGYIVMFEGDDTPESISMEDSKILGEIGEERGKPPKEMEVVQDRESILQNPKQIIPQQIDMQTQTDEDVLEMEEGGIEQGGSRPIEYLIDKVVTNLKRLIGVHSELMRAKLEYNDNHPVTPHTAQMLRRGQQILAESEEISEEKWREDSSSMKIRGGSKIGIRSPKRKWSNSRSDNREIGGKWNRGSKGSRRASSFIRKKTLETGAEELLELPSGPGGPGGPGGGARGNISYVSGGEEERIWLELALGRGYINRGCNPENLNHFTRHIRPIRTAPSSRHSPNNATYILK